VLSRTFTPWCLHRGVRRLGTISWEDVEERRLTEFTLARSLKLGDLTERVVLGRYGLAGDISTGTGTAYHPSQEFAARLYELGFDGIYYTARHDPAFLERSVAVFGGSGDQKLFATSTTRFPERWSTRRPGSSACSPCPLQDEASPSRNI